MAQEQLLPEMMPGAVPQDMALPPEMPMAPGEEVVAEEVAIGPGGGVVEEGIMSAPIQSDALQSDPAKADASATRIVAAAKAEIYGDQFDKYMNVFQNSDNVVEDAAVISTNLLLTQVQAAATTDRGVPMDHMLDVTAEVVKEVMEMAIQTGAYQPNSSEEVERNQNIALTMTLGELGKHLGKSNFLPDEGVAGFMEDVMAGQYDSPETQQAFTEQPEMPPEMPPGMPV